jgi:hypothetical protein
MVVHSLRECLLGDVADADDVVGYEFIASTEDAQLELAERVHHHNSLDLAKRHVL